MILYREHRGGLKESMKTLKKFISLDEFKKWYFDTHDCTAFKISKYFDSCDDRIDWPFTMLVSDNRFSKSKATFYAVGFLTDNCYTCFNEFCCFNDWILLEFYRPGCSRIY